MTQMEGITFFSHYFKSISTKFNKPARNDDGFESNGEMSIFKKVGKQRMLHGKNYPMMNSTKQHILQNCEEVSPFIEDDVEPQTVLRTNDQENEEDNFINDNQTDVSGSEETEEELLDDDDGEDSDEYF
ncbi:hypothetical protein H5410_042516 [Solanum commersonii]|uniref:Uncharacterized protein n=1 Tax=Solanum commersonii TaxID=4109 RepID=A0A9J5XW88_SOLCO|nr:hypothetical protein H5410_042516 [Solanum commersonii]